ncbi:trypsin-like serine peptidase [Vibrio parahaemolyticus]
MFKMFIFLNLLLPTVVQAQQDLSESESIVITEQKNSAAVGYWSEEAMVNAIPFPAPEISENEMKALQEFQIEGEVEEILGAEPEILGTPERANISLSPYNKGGKLFFKLNGKDYSCSAQFVGSTSVLMTAAHCVRATSGSWATNVVFRRAYSNGGGQVVGTNCLSTKKGWVNGGNGRHKWDYAFIKASGTSNSGYMGLKTGIPNSQLLAIGYPKNYGGARYMYQVTGSKGKVTGGVVQMIGNPMRSGNSGGAWLGSNIAVGLNSFHYTGNSTDEWSPYFDRDTMSLYRYASNGCQ